MLSGTQDSEHDAVAVSEARLRLALRGAHAGVWELDPESGAAFWSPESFSLLGAGPATARPLRRSLSAAGAPARPRAWTPSSAASSGERGIPVGAPRDPSRGWPSDLGVIGR
jgi:PAS domain-containing protein